MSRAAEAFVATRYLLGVRGAALDELPQADQSPQVARLIQRLQHEDRGQRAAALAEVLRRALTELERRRFR